MVESNGLGRLWCSCCRCVAACGANAEEGAQPEPVDPESECPPFTDRRTRYLRFDDTEDRAELEGFERWDDGFIQVGPRTWRGSADPPDMRGALAVDMIPGRYAAFHGVVLDVHGAGAVIAYDGTRECPMRAVDEGLSGCGAFLDTSVRPVELKVGRDRIESGQR